MADPKHVEILKKGFAEWNAWRTSRRERPDLDGADLREAELRSPFGDILRSSLSAGENWGLPLRMSAAMSGADLSSAHLRRANLRGADLGNSNLSGADLSRANLSSANLSGADLSNASLAGTVFADVDLTSVIGLETCTHAGPSVIDHRTLQKSGPLPLTFLRGVGLPDNLINYLPSLLNQAIQHYSCFISYSTKDQEFVERLHADLQNKGVRCWFAPHDLRIGDKILDEIDAAIRLRDKVLLVLSEHSIKSDWIEDEVTAGFEEERKAWADRAVSHSPRRGSHECG